MSIDGPGILDSDLAHDVYNEIIDLYDAGTAIPEIHKRIAGIESSLTDDLETELYLAACAKAFWEIGHLPADLHRRLSRLVEDGGTLAVWKSTSDAQLAEARKAALLWLLRTIAKPRLKPRPRKQYAPITNKLYELGDCLQMHARGKEHYGVVCKVDEHRGKCEYALLIMSPPTVSAAGSFESGAYFGRRIPSSLDERGFTFGPHVILLDHRMLKRENPFEIVGRVDLDDQAYCLGSFGGVLDVQDVIEDFERIESGQGSIGLELLPLSQLIHTD